MLVYHTAMQTPIGDIVLFKKEGSLICISLFEEEHDSHIRKMQSILREELFVEECLQLNEYFLGNRRTFDLAYDVEGTDFQKEVWQHLLTIPYGERRSYKEIAMALNRGKAFRAVGNANRNNPLPILIPCHRVIASNGNLVGYGGHHTDIQKILLDLERRTIHA